MVKSGGLYGVQKLKNGKVISMFSRGGHEWVRLSEQVSFCWMSKERAERLFNFLTGQNIEIIKKYP